MSTTRIVELSTRIAANTIKLDEYLKSHNLLTPSFDVDGPLDTLVPKDEIEIEKSRISIIEDTTELRRLALGPKEHLMNFSQNDLLSQDAISHLSIAHGFPVGSETTFLEIAARAGIREVRAKQIVRHAIARGIFCEPRPGVVAHSAASRILVEDRGVSDYVGANTEELWRAATCSVFALGRFPGSEEPNETGFALSNRTDKSFYEFFSEHPGRARRFANAMSAFTGRTGYELKHIVDGFAWGEGKDKMVVDVGGSQGFASFALARAFPSLSFVVQDLEPVVEAAKKDAPADVAERVSFQSYDFLTSEQPVKGAGVYFFRWIFHEWSDKYAVKILQNLIPALRPGAKIVVNDEVLPVPGTVGAFEELRIRDLDLTMAELQNSHERELDDWKKLFKSADERFEFLEAKRPEGSNMWVIVLEWKGN
ncbi:S-adenosyl-L-methionine-dependent methyltransferase [Hypoxylon trugodes]|uniref:S-adenosyl-L-methionine-dependent methyltransferase n=1 Tax=Hypoxylon trugodes TaxID=326681 RepID=UPI0021921537|nr:S-adenosyl-L-methionine-dependent methyltransferase [Hypoxylon trugodes]KAI1389995.1 S-adenosyl-L-methionine-dependent methyltransferase [Hypoxylon trugodes]